MTFTTKQQVVNAIRKTNNGQGFHLSRDEVYQPYADLDGSHARQWLESLGFEVVSNVDTGRCGLAVTAEGVHLSTNGFIYSK